MSLLLLLKPGIVFGTARPNGSTGIVAIGTYLHAGAGRLNGEAGARPTAGVDLVFQGRLLGLGATSVTPRYEPGGRITVGGVGTAVPTSKVDFAALLRAAGTATASFGGGFNILGATDPISTRGFGGVVGRPEAGKLGEVILFGFSAIEPRPSGIWTAEVRANGMSPAFFDAHPDIVLVAKIVGETDLVAAGRMTYTGKLEGWTNVDNLFNAGEEMDLHGYVYG